MRILNLVKSKVDKVEFDDPPKIPGRQTLNRNLN